MNGGNSYGCNDHSGKDYYAIDFALASGSAVSAVAAGTAHTVAAANSGGYGNMVWVNHGGNIVSLYAHLSSFAISDGQGVAQGQTLGYSGSTGNSTGPHLHFVMHQGATTWYDGSALEAEPMSGYSGFGNYGLHLSSSPACTVNTVSPTYTATTPSASAASTMTSPAPGSQLSGSSVTFAWTAGTSVSTHWLYVGSTSGSADLYNSNQLAGSQTSQSVSNLPTDGRTLYVRVWSQLSNGWHYNDYTYKAGTQAAVSVPAAPSNVTATATSTTTIHVTWADNANNETGYRISDGTTTVQLGANTTSYNWSVSPSTYKCFATEAYNSAGASAWTSWGCATTPSASAASTMTSHADVVVDDTSSGFVRAGTTGYWHEYSGGYNGHFWWTNTNTSGVDNRAMWTPNLSATGRWQVSVFVPNVHGTTTNARYRVDHQGAQTTVSVNQNNYYNAWVSLGTFTFSAGTGGDVFLGDETYETATQQIAFDAVKWVWVGP
jgi:hypothetical protein